MQEREKEREFIYFYVIVAVNVQWHTKTELRMSYFRSLIDACVPKTMIRLEGIYLVLCILIFICFWTNAKIQSGWRGTKVVIIHSLRMLY